VKKVRSRTACALKISSDDSQAAAKDCLTNPAGVPGYQVKFEDIAFHGVASLRIRSLQDRQQYNDDDGAAEAAGISSADWPLFGMVWPSSRMLAGALAGRPLAGKRILEIGCGLALASLVAHRLQADVTASDCHPLAADFLRRNLVLNGLPPMRYATGHWQRANAGLGRFDLIVGSDLLYQRHLPEALAAFIARHAADGAEVAIVDPGRGHRGRFSRHMQALGFAAPAPTHMQTVQASGEAYRGQLLGFQRD
jgi:predicted nicotinamide N-methyase